MAVVFRFRFVFSHWMFNRVVDKPYWYQQDGDAKNHNESPWTPSEKIVEQIVDPCYQCRIDRFRVVCVHQRVKIGFDARYVHRIG